ncbi:FecR family protein [Edaphobacter aggregans]|uniref:FecR family protein n=1 Tax=Edaphobacter aggregans TaxID=570835 RepID=UPI000A052505|nr:FecR family protein [Edaphobacter aggregans]
MNRLAGLSVLAVALAAGSAAQTTKQAVTEPTAEKTGASAAPDPLGTKLLGDRHVRIVRLSHAQGKVGMDRGAGRGMEQATQNMPIVEGMLLGTADGAGYAEVEFEDGSTMRLGPGTVVKFSQLVTRATGAKATMVRVDRGTVYVSREKTKADEFTVVAGGGRRMEVQPATHMRLELDGTKAEVAVFSGNVTVDGSTAPVMVGKKQTLSVDVADTHSQGELTKKVEEAPYDGWDKVAQKYHDRYAKGNSLEGGYRYDPNDPSFYGWSAIGGGWK